MKISWAIIWFKIVIRQIIGEAAKRIPFYVKANGFEGVSREKINNKYEGDIIKDIEEVVKFIENAKTQTKIQN